MFIGHPCTQGGVPLNILQSLASNESMDTHVHATPRMRAKSSLAQSTRSYPDQVELVLYGVIERELKLCTLLHLLSPPHR